MRISEASQDQRPFAGQRSDIPAPRVRTPSPIQKVVRSPTPPIPERSLVLEPSTIDVIYAEDEEVFRETAIRELLQVGFLRQNIHEAENGNGALEHLARLQHTGHLTCPLVVLLDVRMPLMDGRECAFQIQELVKKKLLRREPFVICISSIHRQVIVDEGKGNFQVVLPKPFNRSFLGEALDLLRRWWTLGHGRQLAAWKPWELDQIDIITADTEPVCRLSCSAAFTKAGVSPENIIEVEDQTDLNEAIQRAQEGDCNRPLIVLLGQAMWAAKIRGALDNLDSEGSDLSSTATRAKKRREPFVVCTSVDSDRIGSSPDVQHFHAFMPRAFCQADVKWCLEFCRLWWLTRGDGPDIPDSDSESEASSASGVSAASEEDKNDD